MNVSYVSYVSYVVYRPPPSPENHLNTNTFLTEWAEFLSHYVTDTVELIVVGDINLHLDAHSHCHTKAMMQTLESCGLQQHIRDPTHYCGHILDVLISRDSSTLLSACEVRDIGLSDNNGNTMNGHYAITCEIKQRMSSTKSKSVSYRKLKAIDIRQFRNSLQASLTLERTNGSTTVCMERYINVLSTVVDTHAPLLHRTITPRPNAPWYTEQLRESKRKRRSLERKWRRSRKDSDRIQYRGQCATVAKHLTDAKTDYYSKKVEECAGNSKLIHQLANKLLVNQHVQQLPSGDDDLQLANRFCDYFKNKIDIIRQGFSGNTTPDEHIPLNITLDHFRPASQQEIHTIIMTFNNKSCELDPLPTWLLKQCTEELLPLISAIINNSLESGVFPYQCKHAIIRPLLKKQSLDADDLKNYRPVSNLQFISKVLEKVVDQQIDEHLNTHSLNDPLQSAYRKNHSTETATIKLCNDIISGMNSGKCTVLASLDLTAAFDTVDHDIFLHRLQNVYGICGIALKWFKSYLSNREYRVSINSSLSNPHSLTCGVPQGSVLGARMYIMYTKPLTSIMAHHDVCYHCYADDTQVYLQCNNTEASIR